MRVYYAEANYGQQEINAALKVLKNQSKDLMCSNNTYDLEKKVAKIFNKKFGLMTNSGSSANLLAIKSLNLKENTYVITPSLTFSTTISPLIHSNLIPYFIDVEINTLQINTNLLSKINLKNVSAICVPNLIGNLANWNEIYNFAKKHNLKIIEDSADTIGYSYKTNIKKFSDVTTTSFYASHVVSGAGFGGVVAFNNKKYYETALSLRSWGRRSSKYNYSTQEDIQRRLSVKLQGINYDDKYIFDDLGYNFIPSEISAAFALVQLKKLKENIKIRMKNFKKLKEAFDSSDNFQTFKSYDNVKTGWLAFPLLLKGKMRNKRKEFQYYLEKNNIQTRTIFTGNIIRQPVAKKFRFKSYGNFEVSDEIMRNGVLLGCHSKLSDLQLKYLIKTVFDAEKKII